MSHNTDLSKLAAVLDTGTNGQVLTSGGGSNFSFADGATGTGVTVHANQTAMIAASADEGSLHYENANNRLYVKAASGFYLLATISNVTPTITGLTHTTDGTTATVADAATFGLTSGQNTVITLAASDPDVGQSLTHSATLTSGTLSNVASSFTQGSGSDVNKFTLVPVTSGSGGTVTYRFDVTDGVGTAQRTASFSIAFQIQNSRYTSLLISANAAGTNSTFTDSSSSGHTITASGVPTQGSFTPYRKGVYSIDFDGSDDYIYTQSNLTDFDFGTGQFTISFWFYATHQTNNQGAGIISGQNHGGFNIQYDNEYWGNSNRIHMYLAGLSEPAIQTGSLSVNQWHYISVQRESTTSLKIYADGIQAGALTLSASYVMKLSGTDVRIGRGFDINGSGAYFKGTVSDLRIVKGSNSGFAVPTEPLTAVTNTKLLACSLPYIGDASGTPKIITLSGDPKTVPSGPYNYESVDADDGGSIGLNGSEVLNIPSSNDFALGSDDYTIELWAKPLLSQSGTTYLVLDFGTDSTLRLDDGLFKYRPPSGATPELYNTGSGPVPAKVWSFLSIARTSGITRMFLNGVMKSKNSTGGGFFNAQAVRIGARGSNNSNKYKGELSDLRIIKGTSLYQSDSSFTPPAEPLPVVTNTKLLVSGQGAKIFDKSQTSNLTLLGNTIGSSNNQSGNWANTFSTYFDGSDHLTRPVLTGMTGDFCIEGYHYLTSRANARNSIWGNYSTWQGGSLGMFAGHSGLGSSTAYQIPYNGSVYPSFGTIQYNQWVHFCLQRSGTTITLYIDGSSVGTITNATANVNGNGQFSIGALNSTDATGNYGCTGYLRDFRISTFARYANAAAIASSISSGELSSPLKG